MSTQTLTRTPAGVRVGLRPPAEAYAFIGADQPLQPIAVLDVTLQEGEALAAVELATVCECDLRTTRSARAATVPQILGHEQVGRIVALGPGAPAVTADGRALALGDRVVWAREVACGRCDACRTSMSGGIERTTACLRPHRYGNERATRGWELSGGIATHVHLLAGTVAFRARDWVPAEVLAPSCCAGAAASAALACATREHPLEGARVVISDAGMRGVTAAAMAAARGAVVTVLDADPVRRERALRFGAAAVSSPDASPTGHDVALDFVGSSEAVNAVAAATRRGGLIVVPGDAATPPTRHPEIVSLVSRELRVRVAGRPDPAHVGRALAFLERADAAVFAEAVGETVPLREAPRAFAAASPRRLRTAIRP